MAVDYKNLKFAEASGVALEAMKKLVNIRNSEKKPLINIEKLKVSEDIVPLLKNVNTFLSLNEYERASVAADKIISEYPDSAAGWFAKTVAITDNFSPVNLAGNTDQYNPAMRKTYLNYKNNTLKMATHENIAYISECFDKYDDICVLAGSICTFSNLIGILIDLQETKYEKIKSFVEAELREVMAYGFGENSNIEDSAKDHPDSLVLCLYYALNYLNKQNYNIQCEYYGITESDKISDHFDSKRIEEMRVVSTSLSDIIKKLDLYPKQSNRIEYDGFISIIYSFCDILRINPGNISKYYSPQTQLEIRELEKQELERIRQEEIQAEIRRQQEREQREKEEKERKAKKKRDLIIKLVVAAVIIVAGLLCINPLIDFIEDKTGVNIRGKEPLSDIVNTTESSSLDYYIISDDYSSVNVRSGAGTSYSVVKNVSSKSVRMYPTGRTDGNWIEVSSDDFGVGWVSKNIVKFVNG